MSTPEYFSSQILTTTINIEPRNIKEVINDSNLNLDFKKITNHENPEI